MDWGRGARASWWTVGPPRMLPLLAAHVATEFYRHGRSPPVTAGLIVANTLIYLRPGPLHTLLPGLSQVAFNPHLILKYGDLRRFFLSAFYHTSESHLVYNMLSLLWKGLQLESSMGSAKFASMVAVLVGLSQGVTLILSKALLSFFNYDAPYYDQFAVGFSGVLFALKVVLNANSSDYTYLHGLVVPSKYAAWAELILIQLFVPGVSFLGHLGGIIAGLLYIRMRSSFSGPDLLASLLSSVGGVVRWPLRFLSGLFGSHRPRTSGRGRVGHNSTARTDRGIWRCSVCTYDNSAALDICDMCSSARGGIESDPDRGGYAGELTVEELRRRRLERFRG